MKPSKKHLIRSLMADQITDYRCAIRDGYDAYAKACLYEIRILFRDRHTTRMDRSGRPTCLG